MKKIIPFKKDLTLNNKVYEIASISLEHEITSKKEDVISGEFNITGSYKLSQTNPIKENFEFTLPFDIALDSRYDTENMVVDIDDFYYEINENILKVNIDLYLDGNIIEDRCIEEETEEEIIIPPMAKEKNYEKLDEELKEEYKAEPIPLKEATTNLINFDETENFATYHVYMVKEEDTLDSILNKYEISKEDLQAYNNISDVKVGDKLIIPCPKNEWS